MIEASFAYISNTSIEALADRVRRAGRVLVTTHAKPDGDALGSVLTVVRCCAAIGVAAEGWFVGPFEPSLLSLAAPTTLELVDPKKPHLPAADYDLIVIVDTGAWTQLETLAPWLRGRFERTIGVDHHARGDLVAQERVVDVGCGSCTALLARLVDALGVSMTYGADERGHGSVAEAIYLGVATDTGWFRFANARGPEFSLAARLLDAGVDKDRIIETIEQNHRRERIKIEARALSGVRFVSLREGRGELAIMRLSLADFRDTGAVLEETAGVVNLPMVVGSVRGAALFIESEPGLVKISFRSKPKDEAGRFLDVNQLAAKFGGGGHVHAAGAKMTTTLDEAERRVIAAL
ncbi:MAG: DHH family phosphoesterase [Phycisphaerae bacterium]|nr:DHH family phosphoesterase [Phycisphaerae bacterium]